jgi:hypothetical protein
MSSAYRLLVLEKKNLHRLLLSNLCAITISSKEIFPGSLMILFCVVFPGTTNCCTYLKVEIFVQKKNGWP